MWSVSSRLQSCMQVMENNLRALMWCPGETAPKLGGLDLMGRLAVDINRSTRSRRPLNSSSHSFLTFLYACSGSSVSSYASALTGRGRLCPSCFQLCQRDLLPFSPITFHSSNNKLLLHSNLSLHNSLLLHAFALMSPLPGMLFFLE